MKQNNVVSTVTVLGATTVAMLLIGGILFWKRQKQKKSMKIEDIEIPTKWKRVGEIGELILYPLKGAKRMCVTSAECSRLGLREHIVNIANTLLLQDRVFVIYNKQKEFINAKKITKLSLVETTAIDEYHVKFSYGDEDITVKIPDTPAMNTFVMHYGENVETVDCGEAAAEWFSKMLTGQPSGLRLGCFVQALVPPRSIHPAWDEHAKVYTKWNSEYMGAYSDAASYMLMSEESVSDLNKRLEKPVSEHNFRPNIMVKGAPAYAEDTWDWIKIGDQVVMRTFKYCTRCIITSLDADTAVYDPSTEPLRTLRKYRLVKEPEIKKLEGYSPVMGMYAGLHRTGIVHVGDSVYVA